MLGLVGEGSLRPTAQQVAERAGVGIRSVFRHFEDMEGLHAAMSERVAGEALGLLLDGEPSGGPDERCREMIARRAAFFERIGPYKRCGNLHRAQSEYLQREHSRLVRGLRAELMRWLPELATAGDEVIAAVELVTSFEAWDRLRSDQRLGRDRARAVVEASVRALLMASPGIGEGRRGG